MVNLTNLPNHSSGHQSKTFALQDFHMTCSSSFLASVPSKLENEVDNEVKNLPEPFRADDKDAEHKLEDQPQEGKKLFLENFDN